jgi:hypothetical protein
MLFSVTTTPTSPTVPGSTQKLPATVGTTTPELGTTPPPPPGPNLATANWTSNRIWNPDFEDWDTPISPRAWGQYAHGASYNWFATQPPWHVSQGSYSAGLQCYCPTQSSSSAAWSQTVNAKIANLSLAFHYYCDANGDPVNDWFYLMLWFNDGRYLYYSLNGSISYSNSSTTGVYLLHQPSGQWNTFSRNLTNDYVAISQFPKSVTYFELSNLYFFLQASGSTSQYLRGFVDDVNLVNSTNGYLWIGGTTRDGNFESHGIGSPWNRGVNQDASGLHQSATRHSGSWSLNMTSVSWGNATYAFISASPQARLTSINQGALSFWWHLDYQNLKPLSRCYLFLECDNATHTFWIYYLLTYGGTSCPFVNATNMYALRADQFNATGSWIHFQRNVWQDAASYFHTPEIFVHNMYLYTEIEPSAGPPSRIVLLVDDMALASAAINAAGYEDQGNPGTLIRGWSQTSSDFTVTDMVYAGGLAANLTISGNRNSYMTQPLIGRPLNGTRETYLDLMWQLADYTPAPLVNAYVGLSFTSGKYLGYYLAVYPGELPSNMSTAGYFNVTGVGTTGAYIAMHRDLVHDYQAVFGSLPDDYLYELSQNVNTVSSRLSLMTDDLYLYDDPYPRITNVQRNPLAPEVLQPVQVTATIVGQEAQFLHYRVNGASWATIPMYPIGSNNYEAWILGRVYNEFVEYYLTANDSWVWTAIALNGTAYWSYTPIDHTPPSLGSVARTPVNPVYTNQVNVSAIAVDPGSWVALCALYYRSNGGAWTEVDMSSTGSVDGYYAYIPARAWNTYVEYYVNATNFAQLSAIADNGGIYFGYTVGDTINPLVGSIARTPSTVNYLDTPVVSCDVTDAGSGVKSVLVFYRLNGGSWTSAPMMQTSGNHYEFTLATPQPYGTFVQYYINASDNAGNRRVDNNGGSYYSYTVVDNINPSVAITAPSASQTVSGTTTIAVTASDDGTNVTHVEIRVDGTLVSNDTSAPYQFAWNTATASNGDHTIVVTAFDYAGNSASDTVTVTVNNAAPPAGIPGFPWPAILLACVAAITLSVLRRRRIR